MVRRLGGPGEGGARGAFVFAAPRVPAYGPYNTMGVWLRQHDHPKSPSTVLLASSQINRLDVKSTDRTRLPITEGNRRAKCSSIKHCDRGGTFSFA
ncbi:MAG: hypothetical protein C7B43_16350 [Sulfobacillus benefaciens]|jgi:hypothetical protein|uniref:Uncharacterized protein n=1 Tax=Sulfobacillus benefaciens TaxID=453960 RepID=A0A2T2WTY4_9FIRM|nr:MAG: hypothetical protein C7B43_16350 [Sulfobacillus benefaciens]